jgi:DNA-binding transcriptional MerR regulator
MEVLDIGEVSGRTGVPVSTLRYYEERGLIASVGRRGLRRQFGVEVVDRLALVALGRAAGFTLSEIASMFSADGRPLIDRKTLMAKADQLENTIRRMSAMRDGLRHTAACKAPSHLECPSFQGLLRAAAAGLLTHPDRQNVG